MEVHTDQGLVGIGPAVDRGLVPAAKAQLVGGDPFGIERHAARLRYYAQGMPYRGAAGIDIAIWDPVGKACGQPLYKLWGGDKDRVVPYASLVKLSPPHGWAALAVHRVSRLRGES